MKQIILINIILLFYSTSSLTFNQQELNLLKPIEEKDTLKCKETIENSFNSDFGTYINNRFSKNLDCLKTAATIVCNHIDSKDMDWEGLKAEVTHIGNPDKIMPVFKLFRSFANHIVLGYTYVLMERQQELDASFFCKTLKQENDFSKILSGLKSEFSTIQIEASSSSLSFNRDTNAAKPKDQKSEEKDKILISNPGSDAPYSDIDLTVSFGQGRDKSYEVKFAFTFDTTFQKLFKKPSFTLFDLNIYVTDLAQSLFSDETYIDDKDYNNLELDQNFALLNLHFPDKNNTQKEIKNKLNQCFIHLTNQRKNELKNTHDFVTINFDDLSKLKNKGQYWFFYTKNCLRFDFKSKEVAEYRYRLYNYYLQQANKEAMKPCVIPKNHELSIQSSVKEKVGLFFKSIFDKPDSKEKDSLSVSKLFKDSKEIVKEDELKKSLDQGSKATLNLHKAKFFANEAYFSRGAVLHVLANQLKRNPVWARKIEEKSNQIYNEFNLLSSFITNIGMGYSHCTDFMEKYQNANKSKEYFLYEAITKVAKYYDRAFQALKQKFNYRGDSKTVKNLKEIFQIKQSMENLDRKRFKAFIAVILDIKSGSKEFGKLTTKEKMDKTVEKTKEFVGASDLMKILDRIEDITKDLIINRIILKSNAFKNLIGKSFLKKIK